MTLVLVVLLTALVHAGRSFSVGGSPGSAGTALSLGYLLLVAFFVGDLFKRLRLPKLTGYIVAGIVTGPAVLDLVPAEAVGSLSVFSGVAVAMIALSAGVEMEIEALRPLLRSVLATAIVGMLGTIFVLTVGIALMGDWIPFLREMHGTTRVAVALVLAVVLAAKSPAVVIALRDELAADGPISRTVLGVVVIGDLLVIVLFPLASTLAKASLGAAAVFSDSLLLLAWELGGSVVAGLLLGGLLALYFRAVPRGGALFVVTVCFVVAEVGRRLGLDPLIACLTAGTFVRNATKSGPALHARIESSSLPVYVVFFAVAGASTHLGVLATVGGPAVILVVVRAAALLVGARAGATLGGAPALVRRYVGFGLLPQAGLALALAAIFVKAFPEFGAEAKALTLGIVSLNELLTPALYRAVLVRSGEAGAGLVSDTSAGKH